MGQKVNPIGLRLGVIRTWDSRWYAKGQTYFENLHEDVKLFFEKGGIVVNIPIHLNGNEHQIMMFIADATISQ